MLAFFFRATQQRKMSFQSESATSRRSMRDTDDSQVTADSTQQMQQLFDPSEGPSSKEATYPDRGGSWIVAFFVSQGLLAHCSVNARKSDTATLEHQHILHPAMKSHMQLPATIPATIATATSIARGATYVSRVHLSDIWQLNFLSCKCSILYCPLSTCHLTYLYVAAYFSIPCNFRTLGGKLTQFDIWVLPCKVLRISWGSGRVKIFPRLQMETLCFNQLPWDSWVWQKSSRTCLKRQTPIGIIWNPHPIISKKLQKLDLNRFMPENSSFLATSIVDV